jgi:hypothetical protein
MGHLKDRRRQQPTLLPRRGATVKMIDDGKPLKYVSPLTGKPCKSKPNKILNTVINQQKNLPHVYTIQKKWRDAHPSYMAESRRKLTQKYNEQYYPKYEATHQTALIARSRGAPDHVQRGKQCESCGSIINLEGHHPDYSKPKKVITLCRLCHRKIHSTRLSLDKPVNL